MVSGSCLCKKLTYEITADEDKLKPVISHCPPCRKLSGSTYSTNLIFPLANLTVHSTPQTSFSRKGDSGKSLTPHFCDGCGVTIYVIAEALPGMVIVKAGTIDEEGWLEARGPAMEVYCKDKLGWLPRLAEIGVEASPS